MGGGVGTEPVLDGRGAGAYAELGVDAANVVLDGLLRQEQVRGDLAVRVAPSDQGHDLALARRQPAVWRNSVGRNTVGRNTVTQATPGRAAGGRRLPAGYRRLTTESGSGAVEPSCRAV